MLLPHLTVSDRIDTEYVLGRERRGGKEGIREDPCAPFAYDALSHIVYKVW